MRKFSSKNHKSKDMTAAGSNKRRLRREQRLAWGFLLPSLIGTMIFFVVPYFVVIYYSVMERSSERHFVFLQNFKDVINNKAFQLAASNTAKFSAVAVPLAVILSLFLAIVLLKDIPFNSNFRTFFLSPLMVPLASVILVWQVLFNNNGAVNELMSFFGGNKIDWLKSSYAQVVIVILYLWKNLGYNMILFMSALAAVPKDLLEVAYLENATTFQIFIHIKLRFLSSTILFVTIMSLINSFKVFREVYMLTTDYPYDSVYMLQHFMNNTFSGLNYQKLSSAAILMSLVMIVIIGALFIIENHFGKDIEG